MHVKFFLPSLFSFYFSVCSRKIIHHLQNLPSYQCHLWVICGHLLQGPFNWCCPIASTNVFYQQALHWICGVPHNPDNITYKNHFNLCNTKFFQSPCSTPRPVPWDTTSGTFTPNIAHGSSTVHVTSKELIGQPSSLTSHSSTPT